MLGNFIAKIFRKTSSSQTDEKRAQSLMVRSWFRDRGDQTLRLSYPLNTSSVVLDLGGYEGQWTADIYKKYQSSVMVFEPYLPFYEKIVKRFANNPKISAYPFGLGKRTEKVRFAVDANASAISSNANGSGKSTEVQLVSINEFLSQHKIASVDLIKINIEGGEYELLEQMIESGIIETFIDIQVQFHNFVPQAKERMQKIQAALQKTHDLTYQYEFVWENWRRKS